MIVVKVMGGLGNQMFQYALARALLKQGKDVQLDLSYYENIPKEDTIRKFELNKFGIIINKASKKDILKFCNAYQYTLEILGKVLGGDWSNRIVEKEQCYNSKIFTYQNKYLVGYWQNEKYFTNIRNELLNDFNFNKLKISQKNDELRQEILRTEKAVAIHVRGGDYLHSNIASIYGGICTREYYQKAFSYLEDRLGEVKYYLFTNDFKWTNDNIVSDKKNVRVIDWNSEQDGWIDMYLMSLCKHNVIANSSFSWWAAWLNQNEKKIVIAPTYWTQGHKSDDIVPEDWIQL